MRRLATSLPEPGSVRPKPPSVSPPASSRSARSRSSSLPNCRIGQQQTELVTLTVTADRRAGARELLDRHDVADEVEPCTSPPLGHEAAEEAHLAELAEDRQRELALRVALGDAGTDALLAEAAQLLPQQLLLLGEREVDRAGGRRLQRRRHASSTARAITSFWISLVPS